jgi:hypothetical protein
MTVVVIAVTAMTMWCLLLLRVPLIVVRRMLVVLPQQIEAVIVAIRCPHDGVDVEIGPQDPGPNVASIDWRRFSPPYSSFPARCNLARELVSDKSYFRYRGGRASQCSPKNFSG